MVPPRITRLPALTPFRRDLLIALAALAAHLLYLLVSCVGWRRCGYPLDDSWIYQTYARNLADSGQWAFVPGVPSSGSTSILWTPLLVPGHLLPLDPRLWTWALGLLALAAAALGTARLFEGASLRLSLAAGLAVALEWHLVWAAASGMETALFAALAVWFWVWLQRRDPAAAGHRWRDGLLLGVWGGLLLLARPEGILAAAAAGVYGLLCRGRLSAKLRWGALAALGLALLLVPFFALNVATSGALWPNTFYAKQTEYAVLWAVPYGRRLLDQTAVTFVGAQALLIPALLVDVWQGVRRRDWLHLLPLVWVALHWALYAARLPVTYQHGRYAMPVIGVLVAYGIRGMVNILKTFPQRRPFWMVGRVWALSYAVLAIAFVGGLGAPAYARDVAFVEEEMVAAARWVAGHTDPQAVIAAHDIGALGYFAPRPLVDLAGLVSPDVLPYMHSAEALDGYIRASGAQILVVFPHWSDSYADLVARPSYHRLWSVDAQAGYGGASALGPMTVYEVR